MRKMKKMTAYLGICLTPLQKESVRNRAKEMNISMSEYVRYCLDRSSNIRMDRIDEKIDKLERIIYNQGRCPIGLVSYKDLKPPRRVIEKKTTTIEINFCAVVTELKETFKTKNVGDILKPIQIEEDLGEPIEIII